MMFILLTLIISLFFFSVIDFIVVPATRTFIFAVFMRRTITAYYHYEGRFKRYFHIFCNTTSRYHQDYYECNWDQTDDNPESRWFTSFWSNFWCCSSIRRYCCFIINCWIRYLISSVCRVTLLRHVACSWISHWLSRVKVPAREGELNKGRWCNSLSSANREENDEKQTVTLHYW